jgi:ADP-heptose:LPS heptosyltransferase
VLTTPVIRSLKKQLVCELHAVTKKQNAVLFQNNPHVDKVFSFEKELEEILSKLKAEQYDFVVDLQKNLRSLKIKRVLGAASTTFPKVNIQKWLLVNLKVNYLPKVHIVDRYFEAVKSLGVMNDLEGLGFYIPPEAVLDISKVHKGFEKGYVAFVIGGQHFTKIFPPEKVAEVINKLDIPVMLLGGKEDFSRGEEIVEKTIGKTVINTCGKFSLNQSASLVQQCNVLITNDTGLMHIGAAFQKPIVSIWGNTVPDFGMYPYMPGNEEQYYISEVAGLSCRPCSKLGHGKCPKKHFRCMMDQDIDAIVNKVNEYNKALSKQV